ncbi:MAG TPA: homocysteine S-methyltransferase family protein [Anaerolinea sp.]|nr:homocysteine S-methyltransferase family protein [Anaerolinea sp.]
MPTIPFLKRIQAGKPLVIDGATGTNLQARGLPAGTPSDLWVLDNPAEVLRLHRDFIAAGSDIILTNTFGSSRLHLAHAGLEARFEETNRGAVYLAREAAGQSGVLVAGSLGPLGEMVAPVGTLSEEAAQAEYAAQARLLAEAGVDLLVIETQFDMNEAQAAVRGARSVSSLPLVCSFSYDRGTRTMMGLRPAQAAAALDEAGLAAIGINCGRSLEDNLKALGELRAATGLPIWFKPNAGLPRNDAEGRMVYDTTPEMMGEQAPQWLAAGASCVGGCCGTSPEHLRAIAQAVRQA